MSLFRRHQCDMRVLDVQNVNTELFATRKATHVLRRCATCRRHDVETLIGEWPVGLFLESTDRPKDEQVDHG